MFLGTAHFSRREFERSAVAAKHGKTNRIPDHYAPNVQRVMEACEAGRARAGGYPWRVTSGYRSPIVNQLAGGVPSSDHQTGSAVDLVSDYLTPEEIADALAAGEYHQIIVYGPPRSFAHFSIRESNNRRQRLYSPAPGVYHEVTTDADSE